MVEEETGSRASVEASVKSCYASWGESYHRDYYGPDAPYPPVHTEIVKNLLIAAGAGSVLDAGCGPASMLRELDLQNLERYGFDLTPEMLTEARRVLGEQGLPEDRLWQGSVLDPDAFRKPGGGGPDHYDAAICVGVFPHIPPQGDEVAIANLVEAVRPGGLVIFEARNELFSLFTLNRYSRDFFRDVLMDEAGLKARAGKEAPALEAALAELDKCFRVDLPPLRQGKPGQPGYDEILSRTHNPFVLRRQAEAANLKDVRVLFYHYHAMPPMLQSAAPELFLSASIAMEDPADWRGYFMASAFLVAGTRDSER